LWPNFEQFHTDYSKFRVFQTPVIVVVTTTAAGAADIIVKYISHLINWEKSVILVHRTNFEPTFTRGWVQRTGVAGWLVCEIIEFFDAENLRKRKFWTLVFRFNGTVYQN
jgi:hypothetical protein